MTLMFRPWAEARALGLALQAGLEGGVGRVSCFLSDSHRHLGTKARSTLAAPSPGGGEGARAWVPAQGSTDVGTDEATWPSPTPLH